MDDGYPAKVIGRFHRLNAATLSIETLPLPEVAIPNSICFSPDGSTMYYCDSMQGRIMCCDYPSMNNQRVFTVTEGKGRLTAPAWTQWAISGMPNGRKPCCTLSSGRNDGPYTALSRNSEHLSDTRGRSIHNAVLYQCQRGSFCAVKA